MQKTLEKRAFFEGFLFTSMCWFRMIEIDQARNAIMRFARCSMDNHNGRIKGDLWLHNA
jgi:hypothetical protein